MSTRIVKHTIGLQETTWLKIDKLAAASNVSRSEYVRRAMEQFLAFNSGTSWDPRRMAEIMEFTQLVADHWLKTNHPDLKEPVVNATLRRMEKYHGG